ncbi:dephospho-CoA kinase [Desulfuromonas soudanensis]|uniref:Dephospho-CoA kinase n=1 Tax=Desulfuromonas soudanensis TaxID=1603606 RepID=A0A0M4CZ59_9BACT|nr:dephospho-CoA kinase [Desulfuromonas soudanensis]ALC15740.1 dephospho-CoA kinase [Desulfuromonas soudanensis]
MILGVTGGIASGKSTVTEILASLGATVVSADQLARQAVRPGTETLERLVRRFGPSILLPDGTLDRKALGSLVFADETARKDLNAIIHPAIAALAEARLQELSRRGLPLIVYEAPLLFEAGAAERVDAVLVVRLHEDLQLRRLMERDGLDEGSARARIASQMPQEEKVARADFLVDNSGSLQQTEEQVRRIFSRLVPGAPASR